jgi:hypothetical protein
MLSPDMRPQNRELVDPKKAWIIKILGETGEETHVLRFAKLKFLFIFKVFIITKKITNSKDKPLPILLNKEQLERVEVFLTENGKRYSVHEITLP